VKLSHQFLSAVAEAVKQLVGQELDGHTKKTRDALAGYEARLREVEARTRALEQRERRAA
jgi:ribosomal protein S17E